MHPRGSRFGSQIGFQAFMHVFARCDTRNLHAHSVMQRKLNGKVVMVTGANQGVGYQIAKVRHCIRRTRFQPLFACEQVSSSDHV